MSKIVINLTSVVYLFIFYLKICLHSKIHKNCCRVMHSENASLQLYIFSYRIFTLKLYGAVRRASFANDATAMYSQISYGVNVPELLIFSSAPKLRYGPGYRSPYSDSVRVGQCGDRIMVWRDFPHPSRSDLGPTHPPTQRVPGLSRGWR
jgi:hypothetical protein